MVEPKPKQNKREAGARKFKLPEREARAVGENPLRELLAEARVQEAISARAEIERPTASVEEAQRPRPTVVRQRTPKTPVPTRTAGSPVRTAIPDRTKPQVLTNSPLPPEAAAVAPQTAARAEGFKGFADRWSLLLRPNQVAICRVLWDMTHGIGEEQCFTSMTRLAAAAETSERQCYRTVVQLEQRGFVERIETYNTASTKGTIFRLHLSPVSADNIAARKFHIGE